MQIDNMQEGEVYELDGRDAKTAEPEIIRFTIVKKGWFPSPVKPGVSFPGIMVRLTDDPDAEEHMLNFISAECSRKVETTDV